MLTSTTPYSEGQAAYTKRLSFFDNPYFGLVDEQEEWATGWGEAQRQASIKKFSEKSRDSACDSP